METHSPSAVDSAFYGLKRASDLAGIPSLTDDAIAEAMSTAPKRVHGTSVLSRKQPISALLIHDIKKSDLDNPVKLRNVSMYVLSFAGFFRFDDVSRIRRRDISFKEGFMIIKVLKSKSDQLRKGVEFVILQSSSSVFPVELLKRYLVMFKIPPDSKDFISSPFLKGRALATLLPLISPLVTLLLEGRFAGTCKVLELNRPSWVGIL